MIVRCGNGNVLRWNGKVLETQQYPNLIHFWDFERGDPSELYHDYSAYLGDRIGNLELSKYPPTAWYSPDGIIGGNCFRTTSYSENLMTRNITGDNDNPLDYLVFSNNWTVNFWFKVNDQTIENNIAAQRIIPIVVGQPALYWDWEEKDASVSGVYYQKYIKFDINITSDPSSANKIYMLSRAGTGQWFTNEIYTSTPINEWHMYTIANDTFYVNGQNTNITMLNTFGLGQINFGATPFPYSLLTTQYHYLDNVRVFNKKLTQLEVLYFWNNGVGL